MPMSKMETKWKSDLEPENIHNAATLRGYTDAVRLRYVMEWNTRRKIINGRVESYDYHPEVLT